MTQPPMPPPKNTPIGIGGFFEFEAIEENQQSRGYHPEAIFLNNGRSCLSLILETTPIQTIYVPFYICDSILAPLQKRPVNIKFYGLTPAFDPVLPPDFSLQKGSAFLYVNYWGLKEQEAFTLSKLIKDGGEGGTFIL
ncbi:MAG: hypothetical protein K2X66_11870, partial [Cyanobacteria bacterium]|nr:hypothetical protein [Cyanobacteriota bacterium]